MCLEARYRVILHQKHAIRYKSAKQETQVVRDFAASRHLLADHPRSQILQ
jgi:hypothetical protein